MKQVLLEVYPAEGGWHVDCDLPLERTFYKSGGRAEASARRLAVTLSDAGHEVRLVVNDRARQQVASHRYIPT